MAPVPVPVPVPESVVKQAELLRLDGNTFFKKERIGAAIDAYTEAITLCPNVAIYWTNRALCFRKREVWTRVEEDCRKAIELDSSSVKAHYMLGLALLEKKEYASGIKELEKALDLGRGANPASYMVEEIWQVLSQAKYRVWEDESSKRLRRLQNLKEACEKALKKHMLDDPEDNCVAQEASTAHSGQLNYLSEVFHKATLADTPTEVPDYPCCNITLDIFGDPEDNCVAQEASTTHSEQLNYLSEVFHKATLADTPTEVPDYLCCKITLDIFRDPVITPSGVTYERAVLLDHLQRVGRFDPLTREPLEPHQLVPNLGIKEAVQAFLEEHGWAYRTS